ncbi:MAG: hypothetical protein QHJ73_07580, partial [Armatimonadota bacterium]|nr:hypothetical protein [Armatimonadota bacterium]
DTASGARRSLRTSGSYAYRDTGAERRFEVVAEPVKPGNLLISGLTLEAGRGPNSRVVRFVLSTDAAVDVEVMSPSGRVAAILGRGKPGRAGANEVTWSGAVAPGVYWLRATATADDGTSAQAVRPVVVTR